MSLVTCDRCEAFIDTDSFPEACVDPDVSGYDFLCQSCQDDYCEYDEGCGITQEELDRNNGVSK